MTPVQLYYTKSRSDELSINLRVPETSFCIFIKLFTEKVKTPIEIYIVQRLLGFELCASECIENGMQFTNMYNA